MKNSPGNSLFQNSHFDRLQTDIVAPEELEAQEDEIRLQKELKDELEREFDDFDNGSIADSSYSASISGCYNNSSSADKDSKNRSFSNGTPSDAISVSQANRRFRSREYSNLEQLEVLYSVREREIEQLRDEMENLKKKSDNEKFELSNAIKQAQMETQKMTASRNEIQNVLVETTSRLSDAEKELVNLKQKCADAELIKSNALHELEMCKITIRELEQRLLVAEKNSYKSEEANFDYVLKELTSNHKQEISNLEKKISNINSKLKIKEKDCTKLEEKLIDLQRAHQIMLAEKSEMIDKLNASLVKYRSQYQQSVENDKSQDVLKLRAQLEQQINQNETLRRDISKLNLQLEQRTMQNDSLKMDLTKLNSQLEQQMDQNDALRRDLTKLNSQLEQQIAQNDTLRQDFIKLNSQLEQQMAQNEILRRDLANLNSQLEHQVTQNEILQQEILSLNELIKTRKSHEDTSVAAKLEEQINESEALRREISSLMKENESLATQLMQATQEQDVLKISLMDYVTKTDLLHQEQLSELQLACSKQVLELESQLKETENIIKERVFKVYAEEVERTTTEFMNHFDTLSQTVDKLKVELQNKTKQLKIANDTMEDLRSNIDKVYNKYLNARKNAISLKKLADDQTELLRRHKKRYLQTLNEIQKYLDDALVNKKFDNADKLSQLIEKSTKNINADEPDQGVEELSQLVCNIDKANLNYKGYKFTV